MTRKPQTVKAIRITAYETSDGVRHETHTAAVEHDVMLQIVDMLNASKLQSEGGDMPSGCNFEEVARWIAARADSLGALLRRAVQSTQVRVSRPHPPLSARPMPPGTYNAVVHDYDVMTNKVCYLIQDKPFEGRMVFRTSHEGPVYKNSKALITIKHEVSK